MKEDESARRIARRLHDEQRPSEAHWAMPICREAASGVFVSPGRPVFPKESCRSCHRHQRTWAQPD
jgi:hypothetical protein